MQWGKNRKKKKTFLTQHKFGLRAPHWQYKGTDEKTPAPGKNVSEPTDLSETNRLKAKQKDDPTKKKQLKAETTNEDNK